MVDSRGNNFVIYSYDGKFMRKIPIHNAYTYQVVLREMILFMLIICFIIVQKL